MKYAYTRAGPVAALLPEPFAGILEALKKGRDFVI